MTTTRLVGALTLSLALVLGCGGVASARPYDAPRELSPTILLAGNPGQSARLDGLEHPHHVLGHGWSKRRKEVHAVRKATRRFHSIPKVRKAGYARFHDTAGLYCIAMPGMGAMGVHYVNGARVANPAILLRHPEAAVYAPGPHGRLHLAALEYLVTVDAWHADHTGRPHLFGKRFNLTTAPNRYGLPAFYSLHAWVWKHNPAGEFTMWNPRVHCP